MDQLLRKALGLPVLASENGKGVDDLIVWIHWLMIALFIGFCVVLGFPKLRPGSRQSRVVRSLDEVVGGQPTRYLPADAPRGPVDQLHTPELAEAAARKSR